MNPERYRRIRELFLSVRELHSDERSGFLEQACAEDPSLRDEVEKLLIGSDEAASFLETPALDAVRADSEFADQLRDQVRGLHETKPSPNTGDAEFNRLLAGARDGEESAFETLFDSAAEQLLYYCEIRLGRRLGQQFEAIDLVQETYLQAVGSIPTLECDGWEGFCRWLYRVAENRIRTLHDYTQAMKRKPPGSRVKNSGALNRLRASMTGPLTAAIRDEKKERLRKALEQLEETERTAVVYHYFHGATLAEIASELSKSETTTRRILGRALHHLGLDLDRRDS